MLPRHNSKRKSIEMRGAEGEVVSKLASTLQTHLMIKIAKMEVQENLRA